MSDKSEQWFRDQQESARAETGHAIDLAMNAQTAIPQALTFANSSAQRVRNIAVEVRRDTQSAEGRAETMQTLRNFGKRDG